MSEYANLHRSGLQAVVLVAFVLSPAAVMFADDVATSSESLAPASLPTTTVGMPGKMEQIVLPGSELEVKRREDRDAPIVLRIVATYPHGTAHRYDLTYYGLEPGRYDLKDYLRRKDGSPIEDLPALPVEIVSVLPAGQIQPHALRAERGPRLGGYRVVLVVLGGVWTAGMLVILLARRSGRRRAALAASRPATLAERLRPLIRAALEGELDENQKGELERMLLAYWRRRLDLFDLKPADAIAQLREHEEAGQLLRQLEFWLHAPGTAETVDIGKLLKPYENLPADEVNREVQSTSIAE